MSAIIAISHQTHIIALILIKISMDYRERMKKKKLRKKMAQFQREIRKVENMKNR